MTEIKPTDLIIVINKPKTGKPYDPLSCTRADCRSHVLNLEIFK